MRQLGLTYLLAARAVHFHLSGRSERLIGSLEQRTAIVIDVSKNCVARWKDSYSIAIGGVAGRELKLNAANDESRCQHLKHAASVTSANEQVQMTTMLGGSTGRCEAKGAACSALVHLQQVNRGSSAHRQGRKTNWPTCQPASHFCIIFWQSTHAAGAPSSGSSSMCSSIN